MKSAAVTALLTGAIAMTAAGPAAAAQKHPHKRSHTSKSHVQRSGNGSASHSAGSQGSAGGPGQAPAPAGTIASFTGGVLAITLADGSTVSGTVTNATNIVCVSPPPTGQSGQGQQTGASTRGGHGQGQQPGSGQSGQSGQSQQTPPPPPPPGTPCGSAVLTQGAVVLLAELHLDGSGLSFKNLAIASS